MKKEKLITLLALAASFCFLAGLATATHGNATFTFLSVEGPEPIPPSTLVAEGPEPIPPTVLLAEGPEPIPPIAVAVGSRT